MAYGRLIPAVCRDMISNRLDRDARALSQLKMRPIVEAEQKKPCLRNRTTSLSLPTWDIVLVVYGQLQQALDR